MKLLNIEHLWTLVHPGAVIVGGSISLSRKEVELNYLQQPVDAGSKGPTPLIRDETAPKLLQGDDYQTFSLLSVDGGKDAWLFLTACFAIEALVWVHSRRVWEVPTGGTSRSHNIHTLPFFLRDVPGLLQLPRALPGLAQHRGCRDVCDGHHVLDGGLRDWHMSSRCALG